MAFRGRYNSDSNSIAAAEGTLRLPSCPPQSHRNEFVKSSLVLDWQEPEDEGPTRLVGYFFLGWFVLSIVLSIALNL